MPGGAKANHASRQDALSLDGSKPALAMLVHEQCPKQAQWVYG